MRKSVAIGVALALAGTGCGASDQDKARDAAQSYVKALGDRDGKKVCAHMTKGLQKRFTSAVTFANPGLKGDCPKLMQAAIDSVPESQLQEFGSAKIGDTKVSGSTGSFSYTLKGVRVNGKVAQEGGSWKVSCCVPGQND